MTGTIYPDGIDGYSQLPLVIDLINRVMADDVNRLRNAIVSIEKELGINPSGTYGTVKDRLDAGTSGGGGTDGYQSDFMAAFLEEPANKTYYLTTEIPFDGTIESVTTQTNSGTCTVTIEVDGVALDGYSNSASTTEQTQTHISGNSYATGSSISMVVSANASAVDLSVTVELTRTSSGSTGFPGSNILLKNVGTGGIGVFKQKSGNTFQLRNINAGSSKVSVSLDSVHNEIDIDVNPDLFQFTNLQIGTNSSVVSATVATTNATNTTLFSKSTSSNVSYIVEANIVARRTGGSGGSANDSAAYIVRSLFKNNSGTLSANNVSTEYTSEDQTGWNATLISSGTNIIVQVTGALNNNISWHGIVSVQQV